MRVKVGLCGFTMSMHDYGTYFPVVEVQHTFYEPPRDAVMLKWLERTPSIEYTMKVWQLVTHPATSPTYRRVKSVLNRSDEPGMFRDSAAVQDGWRRSVECANLLSATAMLFQSPASFRPNAENTRGMQKFFERIERPRARLLWEPRGVQWIAQRDLALALCRDLNLVHVVDPFVTPPQSGSPVYWRLHGIGGAGHVYTDAQLKQLHQLLLDARSPGTSYVMFNNLPRVTDAMRFCRQLTG